MKTVVELSLHRFKPVSARTAAGGSPRWAVLAAAGLTLAGAASAGLVVNPGSGLSATGFIGGPFAPPSQAYTLSNDGSEALNWSAGKSEAWVSVSASSGTLAAGQSTTVTVFFNAVAMDLSSGTYSASVFFTDTGIGSTTTRSVGLNIGVPPDPAVGYATMLASNQLQMRITGQSGTTFVVQQASNVTGPWTPVYTNTFVGGVGSHTVGISGSKGFYRTSSQTTPSNVVSLAKASVPNMTQVQVNGSPYGTYVLEASANGGSTWTPVATNKAPASGVYTYSSSNTNLQYRGRALGALARPVLDHVLIVGDALALGYDGDPALSTAASAQNFRYLDDGSSTTFLPLYELGFETIASAAANHVSTYAPRRALISNVGALNGNYSQQKKGAALYIEGMRQIETAPQVMANALFSDRPRAIFALAGNGDILNSSYDTDIRDWQSDYQKDIQRVTGYSDPIPMFHCQVSAWTAPSMGSLSNAVSPYKVLAEAEANPARTILVGPTYMLPYAVADAAFPGVFPSNAGNRWLGEYFAKAYKRIIVDGGTWKPLKPFSINRSGAVITVVFDVEAPPLVLDTGAVSNPGNYGFEYTDGSGSPPTIATVQVTGPVAVQITLSASPVGANKRLRYAYTGTPGNNGGPTTGPRGNLRDSDTTPSLYGNNLFNWCVHFDKPVN